MDYSSINEFCEDFAKDLLNDEEKRNLSTPEYQKKGAINFAEFEASY
jgi:hypothetical protein